MALMGLVKELAGHCVLKEHTNERVELILSPAQEHLLKTNQKDRLQNAINARFGENVKLVITVQETDTETPAEEKVRISSEEREEAISSIANDPNIQTMKEIFGASVDEDSIQPTTNI